MKTVALVLAASLLLTAGLNAAETAPARPNIVVFLVDDMGVMDTSVPFLTDKAGRPKRYPLNEFYRTPNMDRLASRGIRFNNFYCMSVCSPTRICLLTGQNAARHVGRQHKRLAQSRLARMAGLAIARGRFGRTDAMVQAVGLDFRLDVNELKSLITDRTKLIIINSPQNPTGGVLEKKDIDDIAKAIGDRDIMVMSDEIYSRLLYEGEHRSIAALHACS